MLSCIQRNSYDGKGLVLKPTTSGLYSPRCGVSECLSSRRSTSYQLESTESRMRRFRAIRLFSDRSVQVICLKHQTPMTHLPSKHHAILGNHDRLQQVVSLPRNRRCTKNIELQCIVPEQLRPFPVLNIVFTIRGVRHRQADFFVGDEASASLLPPEPDDTIHAKATQQNRLYFALSLGSVVPARAA